MRNGWLDVPGYGGAYRIDRHGNVLSVERRCRSSRGDGTRRVPPRVLSPFTKRGRRYVRVCRDGGHEVVDVKSVVAELFLPPPPSRTRYFLEHRDGDIANCAAANLQWVPRAGDGRFGGRA
jgi:hypothetical protein